jgi:hypothetical protein
MRKAILRGRIRTVAHSISKFRNLAIDGPDSLHQPLHLPTRTVPLYAWDLDKKQILHPASARCRSAPHTVIQEDVLLRGLLQEPADYFCVGPEQQTL